MLLPYYHVAVVLYKALERVRYQKTKKTSQGFYTKSECFYVKFSLFHAFCKKYYLLCNIDMKSHKGLKVVLIDIFSLLK